MENETFLIELETINDMLYKNQQLFDLAVDEKAIEALIFERKALYLRYDMLLTRAREKGISCDYALRAGKRSVSLL